MVKTLQDTRMQLQRGEATSQDLVSEALAALNSPEGQGDKTFIRVYEKEAILQAEAIDKVRKSGVELHPLAGIPISIKDLFDVAGEVTLSGSIVRKKSDVARSDAYIVSMLRAAGAIIIGRTNMTEFAFSGLGINPHYGTPLNPWDRKIGRIPGGSSSGAAVSVTDNMAAAAIGTDTGGSVRIPSALCGLTGFKPTAARVPTKGAFPLSTTLDSIGPLANSVACCALLDQTMRGAPVQVLLDKPIGDLTLAIPQTIVLDDMDRSVVVAFENVVKMLSKFGVRIVEHSFSVFSKIPMANSKGGFAAVEAFHTLRHLLETDEPNFDPRVAVRVKRGAEMLGVDYLELLNTTAHIRKEADKITRNYDAVIMPTVPTIAPILDNLETSDELYHETNLLMLRNCSFGNFLNRCAISLPIHKAGEPPVGLMIMGNTGEDEKLLEIANSIEKVISKE